MRRYFLGIIFLLALILRFWNLGSIPDAIDEDEMALGYYGYSLLNEGTDEYGNRFPIYFESVGDYKYGLYSYFAALPVGLFGLNPASTRSVAALAGAMSVIAIFFLAKEVINDERYAYLSALVMALNPTHIHFSRVAYSNVLGAFFSILAILFFVKLLKKWERKSLLASFVFFVLGLFSYQTYRIFLPVTFALIFLIFLNKARKHLTKELLFVALTIVVVGLSFIPSVSRARSQGIDALANKPKLIEQFTEDAISTTPLLVTRAFHNKYINTTLGVLSRYFSYFDPSFLFVRVSEGAGRHITPDVGLLYLIEAPLLILGLLSLFKFGEKNGKFIPIVLLLVSPLAASLVSGEVSTTRAIITVYAYSLIIGVGVYSLIKAGKFSRLLLGVVGLMYLANFLYFSHQYLTHKLYHQPWYSDVGLRQMVEAVNARQADYSAVVVSHGHYMPFLFFNRVLPSEFLANSEFHEFAQADGVKVKRFGKIYFNMPQDCPSAGKTEVLYVCFGYRVPERGRVLETIRFKDGVPAIFLVEFLESGREGELPDRLEYMKETPTEFPSGIIPETYENFWPTN